MKVALRLDRRESVVLAVNPKGRPDAAQALPTKPGAVVAEIAGPWQVTDAGGKPAIVPAPGDWAQTAGWETFSGMLCYHATFNLTPEQAQARFLDLGRVRDITEVWLNGCRVGVRAWAPYVLEFGNACRAGENRLDICVTNSMANAYDGAQLPSGLMGPVVLRIGE